MQVTGKDLRANEKKADEDDDDTACVHRLLQKI